MKAEYFNTTHQTGSTVAQFRRQAETQNQRILAYFQKYPKERFTPSEILHNVFHNCVPITSVRRSMTDLTNAGELRKTSTQKPGLYDRPEYSWTLKTGQLKLL